MKRGMAVLLVLTFATAHCSADMLIYLYHQTQNTTRAGTRDSSSWSGELFYDLASTNVTIVLWSKRQKVFHVLPSTAYVVATISAPGGKTLTALSAHPTFTNSPSVHYGGDPLLGSNKRLVIGSGKTVFFPSFLSTTLSSFSYNDPLGDSFTRMTQACVFSAKSTRSANDQGQSVLDAVGELTQSLEAKGYAPD